MTNKQRYRDFCAEHPEIPLFLQAWWLDAVTAPDSKEWDVLLCEENGKIVGAMPYHWLKKWGFKIILQPQQTQYNGVWIDCPKDIKLYKRYSFEKRVLDSLIDQLEKINISCYSQNFHHSFTNWQPFYWHGFSQTTRYTYVLKNIADTDTIYENIQSRCKEKIKKGERDMTVDFNLSPEEFYIFHTKSLTEKNDKITYSEQLFLSIYKAATDRKQGKIIAVRSKNNALLAALFFVWDGNYAYNLIPARKIANGSNDVSAFMIWETIKYVSQWTKNYDFEGSMIEGVANVNQQFGAEQLPYFNISKSYSKLFSALMCAKNTFSE